MLKNSKHSSKNAAKPTKKLNAPFAENILHKAQKIAGSYRIIMDKNENLGFVANSVELPTVFADGKTPDECYKAIEKALTVAVATMLEVGQKPPVPASSRIRTEQINVRITSEEKMLLADAASSMGFKGISDFIRNIALNRIFSNPNIKTTA